MAQKSDLQKAYEALSAKQTAYTTLWNYYDGNHPLRYSTERLREIFHRLDVSFTQNWCAVVVDSVLDRLNLEHFNVAADEQATSVLNDLWRKTEMELDEEDVHLATLVTGEAFVIVWKNENNEIEAYYNDPRLCHVFYDSENPRRKAFAAKWWIDSDSKRRLTLYYPDRLEYYITRKSAEQISSYKAFEPLGEPVENPFGIIPIFHFRLERRVTKSELTNAIKPQDAVNKLLSDMMVAAEYGAFRQRYVISHAEVDTLKNAPNEIWTIPAGDGVGQATSVGEFSATDLNNYLNAIDKLANSIAIITRTPKHYFYGQGGTPSGEALIAMEAPLNKKAQRYIERFQVTWRKVAAFMLQLAGQPVDAQSIQVVYDDPRTVQPLTQAQIREAGVRAGMPLRTLLRDEGWNEEKIAQMEADQEAESAAAKASLAKALLAAQRRFDQGSEA